MPVYRLRYVEDILQTRPARRQRCDRDARALRKRRPTIPTTQPIASPSHAACNELPDGMRGSPGVVRVETCRKQVSMKESSPIGLDEKITTHPMMFTQQLLQLGCGHLGAQRVSESESASHAVEEAHAWLACSPARHLRTPSGSSTPSNSKSSRTRLRPARQGSVVPVHWHLARRIRPAWPRLQLRRQPSRAAAGNGRHGTRFPYAFDSFPELSGSHYTHNFLSIVIGFFSV